MVVLVAFDLPTQTKKEKKIYRIFRFFLLRRGYIMLQYSLYYKKTNNWASAKIETQTVIDFAPKTAKNSSIRILHVSEKQFLDMAIVYGETETSEEEKLLREELKGQKTFIF